MGRWPEPRAKPFTDGAKKLRLLIAAGSPKGYYARLARAGRAAGSVTVPTSDEAARELTQAQKDEPVSIVHGRWPKFVAGGPDDVRATLEQMVEESEADEVMIQDLIADPAARRHSHELLAHAFDLPNSVEV